MSLYRTALMATFRVWFRWRFQSSNLLVYKIRKIEIQMFANNYPANELYPLLGFSCFYSVLLKVSGNRACASIAASGILTGINPLSINGMNAFKTYSLFISSE